MDALNIIITDVVETLKTGEKVRLVFGYDMESNPVYLTIPVTDEMETSPHPSQVIEREDGCPF